VLRLAKLIFDICRATRSGRSSFEESTIAAAAAGAAVASALPDNERKVGRAQSLSTNWID